ncbi:MAG: DUF58 domain-containing protein [Candidatus Heimdallarchaeota archaeon]|nr:DUF58 domain-containing protein [Candidatus Heimdallarchaeota archaeon]
MRRTKEITPTGILILSLAFVGGLLGMNLNFPFVWIPCFMLILYFIPFLAIYRSQWNISTHRIFSTSTITLGGFLHLEVQITNTNSTPLRITVDNKYDKGIILIKGWPLQRVKLKPGEKKRLSYIFTIKSRGNFEFQPLRLYRGDFLGLYRNSIEIEDSFQVQVIPARPYVRLDKKQKRTVRDKLAGEYGYRRKGSGDEFFSLRDYVRGDEPRKIYWKKSARLGKLISREYEDEVSFRVLVALDISFTMRSRKLEYSLTSLLELAEMCAQNNDAFGWVAFSDVPVKFLKPATGSRLYEKTVKLIYDLKAANRPSHFNAIVPHIFSLKGTKGILVIISDTEGVIETKLKAITQLSKFGHQIIFCDLRSDLLGMTDSTIGPYNLNTEAKIKTLNLVHDQSEQNYTVRENIIREVLDEHHGIYIPITSLKQNLMLELMKTFDSLHRKELRLEGYY